MCSFDESWSPVLVTFSVCWVRVGREDRAEAEDMAEVEGSALERDTASEAKDRVT